MCLVETGGTSSMALSTAKKRGSLSTRAFASNSHVTPRNPGYTLKLAGQLGRIIKDSSMSLSPYLFFDGTCKEAFEFYRSVFGGEFTAVAPFSMGASHFDIAEEDMDRMMHISLPVGSTLLRGCDRPSATPAKPEPIPSVVISCNGDSREECDDIFAKLSVGGQILLFQHDTLWDDYFALCRDRFGVHWLVTCRGIPN